MRRLRAYRSAALLATWAAGIACSVFPDRAVLPDSEAPVGAAGAVSAGAPALAGGTAGNAAGAPALAAAGGAGNDAGTNAVAGSSAGVGPAADSGAGGAPSCTVKHVLLAPSADAWIDAAEPDVNHGSDPQLFVLGGATEQRALFSFSLPAVSAGDAFVGAALVLSLAQPPNLGAGSRTLAVHALITAFKESRVTWLSYANGAPKTWTTPGGDIGATIGRGMLHAGDGVLHLDASALVAAAYSAQQAELGLLVRDAEAASASPVNFAFGAMEGPLAQAPQLDLEYCSP